MDPPSHDKPAVEHHPPPSCEPAPRQPPKPQAWWQALVLAVLLLVGLGWLLGRLVWLPFYFGLFFFLVAGLLTGSIAFRLARSARPLTRGRILQGIGLVAALSTVTSIFWEYRFVALTVGHPPRFAEARQRVAQIGGPTREISRRAERAFRKSLERHYPPGGPIGYIRWAISGEPMTLEVDGSKDEASIDHVGWAWLTRTVAGLLLTAAGLWAALESLRAPQPVTNTLAPGEPYDEE